MPGNGWRKAGPLVPIGLAAFVVLALTSAAHFNGKTDHQRSIVQTKSHAQSLATLTMKIGQQACTEAEQEAKNDPDRHDKRDLCAQFAAAIAAERSASSSDLQLWLGVVGFVAVMVTVCLTTYTALLNRTATQAATKAAEAGLLGAKAALAKEMPDVHINGVRFWKFGERNQPVEAIENLPLPPALGLRVYLINFGKTSPSLFEISYAFAIGRGHRPAEEPAWRGAGSESLAFDMLAHEPEARREIPQDSFYVPPFIELTGEDQAAIALGAMVWIRIAVAYRDFLGDEWKEGRFFCWRPSLMNPPPAREWVNELGAPGYFRRQRYNAP